MPDRDKLLLEIYGEVKTSKNDISHIKSSVDEIKAENKAMWRKVDSHGRWITGAKAVIASACFAAGYLWWWVKHKMGGGS